jgi:hypothetical protein
MNTFKDIWADLVDKRLWPVALILVGALVGVPLVLSTSAPDAGVAPVPQASASAAAPVPVPGSGSPVSDVSGTTYVGPVSGANKDPFLPHGASGGSAGGASASKSGLTTMPGLVASGGAASAGSTISSSTGSGSTGSGSTGSGSTGSGSTGSPTIPGVPSVTPNVVAALQFGLLGGARTYRRVAELTPLPSPTSPAVVYLGQTRRGESAFLVSAEVTPRGQGRCTPSRGVCSTLYLKPGQVEYLTAQTTAGRQIRYRLKFIERVVPVKVTAPAPSAG